LMLSNLAMVYGVHVAGDANGDQVIDYIDLGNLACNYDATSATWDMGDFNFDGVVDYIDLGLLASEYGRNCGGDAAPVPEPFTWTILAAGGWALLRRRRR